MSRSFQMRTGLALTALALALTGEAKAQFGYGYGAYPGGYSGYGWGGWGGGTYTGSAARGLGYYYAGAGEFNLESAEAGSIDTDTVMKWNNYMFQSQQEANAREHARRAARDKHDIAMSNAIQKRIVEKPSASDIANGDALNALLDQITDPRVPSSLLRLADDKIPGKVVRTIPFINASEAVSISLDQLTSDSAWPPAFSGPKFEADRKAYSEAVDKALEEDKDGEISPASIEKLRASLRGLRAKLEASPPDDKKEFGEAESYLKTLYGMTRMLEKPQVDKVIAELEKVKDTSLGSLLGFMHTFNLRFGPATTMAQRDAYEGLYPIMAAQRERVAKGSDGDKKATAKVSHPTDFFRGMHLDNFEGKKTDAGK